jgi:hypothetical protein
MHRKTLIALLGAIVIALASAGAALAAGSGPSVSVQVKSLTKTLLTPTTVHAEQGSVTKGGAPRGKCPGASAAGALDAATHGKWTAKWYAKFNDVFITSILGVKPAGKQQFWEILVNGKPASTGACEIKLHPGEKLVFKLAK